MNIFRKWQFKRRLTKIRDTFPRDEQGKFTDGNALVYIALTPEVAREVHDRAMLVGDTDLAAKVEWAIAHGAKMSVTVAQRSMIRRLMQDATVV